MSGPKDTKYRVRRERIEQLKKERNKIRAQEIKISLNNIKNKLNDYEYISEDKINRINLWIAELEEKVRNNHISAAEIQLNGINNYLNKLDNFEKELADRQNKKNEKLFEIRNTLNSLKEISSILKAENKYIFIEDWIKEAQIEIDKGNIFKAEKSINGIKNFISKYQQQIDKIISSANKKEQLLDVLNSIETDKNICNKGILENISYFKEYISVGKFSEIEDDFNHFVKKIESIKEQALSKEDEKKYVLDTLISITDNGEGKSINGVPIKINFENEYGESKIVFDIDESKGNCFEVLEYINDKFIQNDIELDDIYVRQTGVRIPLNNQNIQTNYDRI